MEKLPFVLWVVLYPITTILVEYYSEKLRMIRKQNQKTEQDQKLDGFINFLIWVVIAFVVAK